MPTKILCRNCGTEHDWDELQNSTEQVEGYTHKVVCPDCGNSTFDKMDDGD